MTVFRTETGTVVHAVTADQMREVDRVAVEKFGLGLLQMMENAGRNLAEHVLELLGGAGGAVTILAGAGGNGGGGLCCARHLHNHGVAVAVVLDRAIERGTGAAGAQLEVLRAAGLRPTAASDVQAALRRSDLVVDALIGYSLRGAPRGRTAELVDLCNRDAARVVSLDLPSGLDATSGATPGRVVRPERVVTLALPKTGLATVGADLYLADIGIPPEVFRRVGVPYERPFGERFWVRLLS
jgi:NAD(P)H-hydrate epimerase